MAKITQQESLMTQGYQVADSFRLGYEGSANTLLVKFIDQIELVVAESAIDKQLFANIIMIMLKAQQRNDTLFLADILQYELLPILNTAFANE